MNINNDDHDNYNNYQIVDQPNPFYNNNNRFTSSQMVLNESLYDRNPIKNVITENVKTSLTSIKLKDIINKEDNEKCSISMEPFTEDDDIIQLPCNHCFLAEQIIYWLTEENCECPVCRYKFESIEKNVKEQNNDTNENNTMNMDNFTQETQHDPENDIEINNVLITGHNMLFSSMINSLFSDYHDYDYHYDLNFDSSGSIIPELDVD
jgi:hypothetical protein